MYACPLGETGKVGFQRNVYLEGSWIRDDTASQTMGNFGLDLKFEVDLE